MCAVLMACLEMYNSEHKAGQYCPPMSPRISFSNDFVESQQMIKHERSSREAPVSTDFEFSVTNHSMMSADELFSKGRLLPFKDNGSSHMQRTIRDELLVEDDHKQVLSLKPPKGSTRWKGFLGLKRSHIGSKKVDNKNEGSGKKAGESRMSGFVRDKELLNEGGSSCQDVDIGI